MTPERWRQITELFHAALSRPAADRSDFVAGSVRGQRGFAGGGWRDAGCSRQDRHGPRRSGCGAARYVSRARTWARIGACSIEGLIGAGGMGRVYRARDGRLGRDVAIKILPAQYAADVDRLRRFEQEALRAGRADPSESADRLRRRHRDGRPYLVTELVDGETLRDRIGRGVMSPARACDVAAAIARGLAAAHAKGVVHRDLKPENVMITRDGRVKILDFGVAKLTTPDPLGTSTGVADGTPTPA